MSLYVCSFFLDLVSTILYLKKVKIKMTLLFINYLYILVIKGLVCVESCY